MTDAFIDPSYVIGLFPDLLPMDFRKQLEYPETIPSLQGRELEHAVLALIKYLTEVSSALLPLKESMLLNSMPSWADNLIEFLRYGTGWWIWTWRTATATAAASWTCRMWRHHGASCYRSSTRRCWNAICWPTTLWWPLCCVCGTTTVIWRKANGR